MLKKQNKNIFLLILLCLPVAVLAQDKPNLEIKPSKIDTSQAKIFLDKINITGKLEKPQTVFVLPGKTPEVDDIQINRSFMKELFRPVEKLGAEPQPTASSAHQENK